MLYQVFGSNTLVLYSSVNPWCSFPKSRPILKFISRVSHPLVNPKTGLVYSYMLVCMSVHVSCVNTLSVCMSHYVASRSQTATPKSGLATQDTIMFMIYVQWNLSKTVTCGPVLTDLYREVAALQR